MTAITGNRIELGIHDTHVILKPTLKNPDGSAINLAGADGVYLLLQKGSNRKEKEMTVIDAGNGIVQSTVSVGMLHVGENTLNVRIQWNASPGVDDSYTTTVFFVEGIK